jgi:DNA-binding beta-propeller fold protein YncE
VLARWWHARRAGNVGAVMRRRLTSIALAAAAVAVFSASAAQANTLYAMDYQGNGIYGYTIGAGGTLTPDSGATITGLGDDLQPAVISPDGRHLYVGDWGTSAIYELSIGTDGSLSPTSNPPSVSTGSTSLGSFVMALTPNGRFLYASEFQGNTIAEFSVGSDGSLSPATDPPTVQLNGAQGLAVSPDGRRLYAASTQDGTVAEYDIGADGGLSPIPGTQPVAVSGSPRGLAVAPDGKELYVGGIYGGYLTELPIAADGSLSSPTPNTIRSVGGAASSSPVVAPDGKYLWYTNNDPAVYPFSIGAGDNLSAVDAMSSVPDAQGYPFADAVTPDGRYLFVGSDPSGNGTGPFTVSGYSVETGEPTALSSNSSYTLAATIGGLVVTPDQGPDAVEVPQVAPAGSESRFGAGGAGGGAGTDPVAAWAWSFGDGTTATGENVTHVFTRAGTYTVSLSEVDSDGCWLDGPWTGQSPSCVLDPNAVATEKITVPAPSNHFTVRTSIARRSHVITLKVTTRAAGSVTVTAKDGRATWGTAKAIANAAGTVKLRLGVSRSDRRVLRSHSTLRLKITVAFAPTDGSGASKNTSATV